MKRMYKVAIFIFLTAILLGVGILSRQTVLSVQPASISDRNLMPGDTFTVNVYIENVTDLYAYQFNLQYNPNVLTIVSVTKGPFLSQGGATFFVKRNQRRYGTILCGETLMGAPFGVSGSGVLTEVLFRVNKRGKTHFDISYTLNAYIVYYLLDSSQNDIGFTTVNGEFSNE